MVRQSSTQHYKKKDGTTSIYKKEFLWCTTSGCTFVKYRSIEDDLIDVLKHLKELDSATLSEQLDHIVVEQKDNAGPTKDDLEKQLAIRRKELERRMDFIYDKFESGVYTDDMFVQRKTEIDNELKELDNININEHISNDEQDDIDLDKIKANINSTLETYNKLKRTSAKNELLRNVFDHVKVEVLERGRGRRPAVHQIETYLRSSFLSMKMG